MRLLLLINPYTMRFDIQNTFEVLLKTSDISSRFPNPDALIDIVDMDPENYGYTILVPINNTHL